MNEPNVLFNPKYRVKLNKECISRGIRKRRKHVHGNVYSDPGGDLVYVLWDGCTQPQAIARAFIERVTT